MKIVGIDPGLLITGYGIIESTGRSVQAVSYGIIRNPSNQSLPARLSRIYQNISDLLKTYTPDEAAIERVFFCKNVQSAIKLGEARAAAILACAQHGIPLAEYEVTRIKQSVTGNGHADKIQVLRMVKALLSIDDTFESLDASDALAIALCHYNVSRHR